MCVPNLVPIGPETATCIRLERYTHRHTLSYIDIDAYIKIIWNVQLWQEDGHVVYK